MRLFTLSQRSLYLFILMQVGNSVEAEEILQEANLVIWSKYDQFAAGTNFKAWARQVAQFEILKWRQRHQREKLRFSDEFLATVGQELAARDDDIDLKRAALDRCLEKLKPVDRALIRERYQSGEHKGRDVAEHLGRPANSVYQSLGRIRRTLAECVQRQLTSGMKPDVKVGM